MRMPFVSIIVITLNEERNIVTCLSSLEKISYPKEHYEVIVVDGKSKDNTLKLVEDLKKEYPNLKVFIDPVGDQTTSRNIGINKSKGEFVAFIDADCIAPENWLIKLVEAFQKHKKDLPLLAGVGGANIPPKETNAFTKAIGIAFDSWLGSLGSIQAKVFDKDKGVFSLSCTNALYEKSKLIDAGLFPEFEGKRGDDWFLGQRIKQKGYKLIAIADSFVWHRFRSSPLNFWKNMLLYGEVRTNFIKNFPRENGFKYYLPFVFIIVMLLPLLFWINYLFLTPLIYFPIVLFYSLFLSYKKKSIPSTLTVFLVFIILHFGYSIGEMWGIRWFFKHQKEVIQK